jgi:hypothetical protein
MAGNPCYMPWPDNSTYIKTLAYKLERVTQKVTENGIQIHRYYKYVCIITLFLLHKPEQIAKV